MYVLTQIIYVLSSCCYSSLLYRVTCEVVEKFQTGKGRKMWAERASKLAIVLVDCGSTAADLSAPDNAGLPLVQLRDAIHKVRK